MKGIIPFTPEHQRRFRVLVLALLGTVASTSPAVAAIAFSDRTSTAQPSSPARATALRSAT